MKIPICYERTADLAPFGLPGGLWFRARCFVTDQNGRWTAEPTMPGGTSATEELPIEAVNVIANHVQEELAGMIRMVDKGDEQSTSTILGRFTVAGLDSQWFERAIAIEGVELPSPFEGLKDAVRPIAIEFGLLEHAPGISTTSIYVPTDIAQRQATWSGAPA